MASLPYLALLVGMVVAAGVDALRDRTPRMMASKPRRTRLDLVWWTRQRTRRERAKAGMPMAGERRG